MVKLMRQIASRWYVGITLSFGMILYSCQASETSVRKDYSGEELFNGIFFGQGEVAASIPAISKQVNMADVLNAAELEQVAVLRKNLSASLKTKNPNFFNEFKNEIQSGDHLRIEKTLKQTSELIFQEILDMSNVQKSMSKEQIASELGKTINLDELKASNGKFDRAKLNEQLGKLQLFSSDASRAGQGQNANCVAVAAVLVLAVAAAAAVVVFIFWVGGVPRDLEMESVLQKEMIVHSIATSLSVDF